jgi:hypothetical protein
VSRVTVLEHGGGMSESIKSSTMLVATGITCV